MPRAARWLRSARKFVGSPRKPWTRTTGVGLGACGSKAWPRRRNRKGIASAAVPSAETSFPTIRKLIIPASPRTPREQAPVAVGRSFFAGTRQTCQEKTERLQRLRAGARTDSISFPARRRHGVHHHAALPRLPRHRVRGRLPGGLHLRVHRLRSRAVAESALHPSRRM